MSPFLFILCAEALVHCLNHAESRGRLNGIQLATAGPSVHHLLFADDSLMLCRTTVEEGAEITNCLSLYEAASGQTINKLKSSIIFGSKVDYLVKRDVKKALGIVQESGEGPYLGLPESFSGSKRNLLSFIREKLQPCLHCWFAKMLSQGVRRSY